MLLAGLFVLPATSEAKRGSFGSRTLAQGARGHDVKTLQGYLTRVGYATDIDGEFGRGTYRRVRSWEADGDRAVNGRVTRADARALRRDVKRGPTGAPTEEPVDESLTGGTTYSAENTVPGERATLNPDGTATAPASAPQPVKDMIAAGNEIAFKPYVYGGGHGNWKDSGYDCSGSVSYALHGAGLLKRPLDSTGLESFGSAGPGRWVTIYANAGHTYMLVAGLRFDTSGAKGRTDGTRWTDEERSASGYVVRHPSGL